MENPTEMTDRADDAMEADVSAPLRARPPVKAPEGITDATTEAAPVKQPPASSPEQKRKPVKVFGVKMPDAVSSGIHSLSDFGARWRRKAIQITPRFAVNNSSNFIGGIQVISEGLMFRSSGLHLVRPAAERQWFHYITDPPTKIVEGVFKKAKFDIGPKQLTNKSFYTESFEALRDIEKATLRDRVNTAAMTNKWSARSGFAGLCAMGVSMVLPSEKDTPEETEKMTKMAKENPVKYTGMRLYQALNPLEWVQHKRQFSGFGMALAGFFSFVSGFRQVEGKFTKEMIDAGMKNPQKYMRNPWQMAGGLITLLGGTQLMMAVDSDKGWRNFGLIQIARLSTLPNSIATRFKKQEQGAEWYLGAQGMLQVKNVVAASIGGAEKRPDGTIVDHAKIRAEALQKARKEIAERKAKKHAERAEKHADKHEKHAAVDMATDAQEAANDVPSLHINQATDVARAMPERAQAETSATV